MTALLLFFLALPAHATTRVIMEQTPASQSTIFVDTQNVKVGIATGTALATVLEVNGSASFGSAATKSTFSATGWLQMNAGSSITLSGSNGFITSGSSITGGAFFGNGANITAIVSGGITSVNAGALVNGPVASSILPSTVAYTSVSNSFNTAATGQTFGSSVTLNGLVTAGGSSGLSGTCSSGVPLLAGQTIQGITVAGSCGQSVASGASPTFTGTNITGIPAGNLTSGPLASSILPSTVPFTSSTQTWSATQYHSGGLEVSSATSYAKFGSSVTFNGLITAGGSNGISGICGAGVPLLAGQSIQGIMVAGGCGQSVASGASPTFTGTNITGIPAGNLTSGPLASSILPSSVTFASVDNNWSASQTFQANSSVTLQGASGNFLSKSSVTASAFFGDGSNLTGISGALSGGTNGWSMRWTGATSAGLGSFSDTGSSVTLAVSTFVVGNINAVTPYTSSETLTAGVIPAFEQIVITTKTLTPSPTVYFFGLQPGYFYQVKWNVFLKNTGVSRFVIEAGNSSGIYDLGTKYFWLNHYGNASGTGVSGGDNNALVQLTQNPPGANTGISGFIDFSSTGTVNAPWTFSGTTYSNDGTNYNETGVFGVYHGTYTVTQIRFRLLNGDTMANGAWYIKKSIFPAGW